MKFLISDRKTNQQTGFTLIELLIVFAIIGLLVMLVGPRCICADQQIQRKTTLVQLGRLEQELNTYHQEVGKYPLTLKGLLENENNSPLWNGPYLKKGLPNDPWGSPYQYQIPGNHGNDYDLFSYGADGQLGGKEESADIGNWQIKR